MKVPFKFSEQGSRQSLEGHEHERGLGREKEGGEGGLQGEGGRRFSGWKRGVFWTWRPSDLKCLCSLSGHKLLDYKNISSHRVFKLRNDMPLFAFINAYYSLLDVSCLLAFITSRSATFLWCVSSQYRVKYACIRSYGILKTYKQGPTVIKYVLSYKWQWTKGIIKVVWEIFKKKDCAFFYFGKRSV